MQQLAAQLQLSIGTVSRALAEDPAIAQRTRTRVAEAAVRLGYRKNSAARALITGRTSIIGVQVAPTFSSFYVEMALRLERIIAESGYMAVVHSSNAPSALWIPDGRICLDASLPPRDDPPRPLVMSVVHETLDFVAVDLGTPTAQAIRHLHQQGCRRIAMLSHVQHTIAHGDGFPAVDDRIEAYHRTMGELGLPSEVVDLPRGVRALARETVAGHLRAHGVPEAILCHNDDAAMGAYRAALDAGIAVPSELSIIGCDGSEFGEYLSQPLSTIVQPLQERAQKTWDFLHQRLRQPELPQQRALLPTRLSLRATSR